MFWKNITRGLLLRALIPTAVILGIASIWIISVSIDRVVNGPFTSQVGGEGQECYQNQTCDQPFTCFEVKDKHICERDIKPVVKAGAKYCFTHQDEQGEIKSSCFDGPNECAKGIGAVMQTSIKILKGCRWEN